MTYKSPPHSHYQVVVVLLAPSQNEGTLNDPDVQFPPDGLQETYSPAFCDEDFPMSKAYVTAEFGANLFPNNMIFIVGGEEGQNAPNDRPDSYTNGLLCYSAQYLFFVRAYPVLDLQVKRFLVFCTKFYWHALFLRVIPRDRSDKQMKKGNIRGLPRPITLPPLL